MFYYFLTLKFMLYKRNKKIPNVIPINFQYFQYILHLI